MMMGVWIRGVVLHRPGRLLVTAAGIAATVALITALGAFILGSSRQLTRRALEGLLVDWQIELSAGADEGAIAAAARKAATLAKLETVGYAEVAAFEAETGGTVQTTGTGKVVGIGPNYFASLPGQLRSMLGGTAGVMLAQQTAANLHASIGDRFTIQRFGLPPVELEVAGIVDLPNADAMFQGIGLSKGAAPQAPPDNVALIPLADWHRLFDPQAAARPDTVRLQMHALIDRSRLPTSPETAYADALAAGHYLEAQMAGRGLLANNLAARLDAVRGDALYAKVLFLFLGAPGIAVAVLLTLAMTAAGRGQRRRDQALLRVRGASTGQILVLAAGESLVAGSTGAVSGVLLGWLAAATTLGVTHGDGAPVGWLIGAGTCGLALALFSVIWPAWRDTHAISVVAERASVEAEGAPLWQRAYIDLALLVGSAASFWLTANGSYQIVLAPEGVAATTVDYQAFLAPFLLWLGLGLLTLRLVTKGLRAGRSMLALTLRPLAGPLAPVMAASLARQNRRLAAGVALAVLAFAFAASTAIFNRTYSAQALVDAQLTNGADLTVTARPFANAAAKLTKLRGMPGVAAAEPMQHRLAYVGADLQDLYGIDPRRIGRATQLSDAYFASGNAAATLALLAKTEDGVLVSEETVSDFQLSEGDTINLRIQSAADHQYHVVPFKFIGVVREFPTAPRDSFLVANASYVARMSGSHAAETVLIKTLASPAAVAPAIRHLFAETSGLKVTDVGEASRIIGSSLTAIDLSGLTGLELGFSFLAIVSTTGLALGLGLADRRRTFAILALLGAERRQIGGFIWSEGIIMLLLGAALGVLAGLALATMLVTMLTGIFDPPPDRLQIPIFYLVTLVMSAVAATGVAILFALRSGHARALQDIRQG
jgi:putative ABC transport system permease protein